MVGQILLRVTGKRKHKDREREEFEAPDKLNARMQDSIDTGAFLEGLMSFGGRMPKDVYNKLRHKYAIREEKIAEYEKWVLSQPMDEPMKVPRKDIDIFHRWLKEMTKFLWRCKTFVATGPSLYGKSHFLKMSLPGNAYLCTCKNEDEPELRTFVGRPYDDNIHFDEAGLQLVETH